MRADSSTRKLLACRTGAVYNSTIDRDNHDDDDDDDAGNNSNNVSQCIMTYHNVSLCITISGLEYWILI